MPVLRSYAIWNNKGGVGKSTIAFHLASRYAEKHPDRKVLVIDLCPQANSSMMLLGGGTAGETHVLSACTATTPTTVVGYISTVIAGGAKAPLPKPMSFLMDVHTFNPKMPKNLYLMCGDGNLEPMSPAISGAAAAAPLIPSVKPWKWVHEIFRGLINSIAAQDPKDEWMVFIDTNPSFSIYTELAVSAADRLITPVNADDSSRVATNAMFVLLHGQTPPHPIYGSWTYATQAVSHALPLPQIHVIVGNRLTQYAGAATAFLALSEATGDTLFKAFTTHPTYFTERSEAPKDLGDFRKKYSVPLRDFNTAGVVSAHLGLPLSGMTQGHYDVHGYDVTVKADSVSQCGGAIDELLAFID